MTHHIATTNRFQFSRKCPSSWNTTSQDYECSQRPCRSSDSSIDKKDTYWGQIDLEMAFSWHRNLAITLMKKVSMRVIQDRKLSVFFFLDTIQRPDSSLRILKSSLKEMCSFNAIICYILKYAKVREWFLSDDRGSMPRNHLELIAMSTSVRHFVVRMFSTHFTGGMFTEKSRDLLTSTHPPFLCRWQRTFLCDNVW